MIIIIICWLVLAMVVALFGAGRSIGFSKSLLAAIFLTPVIGGIITSLSKTKKATAKQKETDRLSKEYLDLINPKNKS
ncbi:MAG: hypothetical protein ABIU63_14635 [Chitinophagaceae bacterium]